jgi:hypothetical protein
MKKKVRESAHTVSFDLPLLTNIDDMRWAQLPIPEQVADKQSKSDSRCGPQDQE